MSKYRKLIHVYDKCDYHIVFTPKYRFHILEGMIKSLVEYDLQSISSWKDVQLHEVNVQTDHIHIVCSIHPKLSISDFMRVLKGEIAIKLFKTYPSLKQKPYWGYHFWLRGYFVSTLVDEEMIKCYVKNQSHHENKLM